MRDSLQRPDLPLSGRAGRVRPPKPCHTTSLLKGDVSGGGPTDVAHRSCPYSLRAGWVIATTKAAGMLRMPTGRLIAADPAWLPSAERLPIVPYTVTAPSGSYPVTLAVVSWRNDRRVAAARLTIEAKPVRRWEMALLPGQNVAARSDGNLIAFGDGGYPVWIGRTATGAVGCFMADMAMLRRQEPTTTPRR